MIKCFIKTIYDPTEINKIIMWIVSLLICTIISIIRISIPRECIVVVSLIILLISIISASIQRYLSEE